MTDLVLFHVVQLAALVVAVNYTFDMTTTSLFGKKRVFFSRQSRWIGAATLLFTLACAYERIGIFQWRPE